MAKREKINVKEGDLSFGQRINIGKILTNEAIEEMDKLKQVWKCLYGVDLKLTSTNTKKMLLEFEEVIDGIIFWIKKETELLKYNPTPEEQRAGINDLSSKIGEFGTVKAIAKAYSRDPDEVLKWKYGKVFGILYTDLEEHRFQVKLQKQYSNSAKNGSFAKYNKR